MKKAISSILIGSTLLIQSGCATIVSTGNQDLKIKSDPAGATVEVDGIKRGQTPVFVKLPREDRHKVIIRKEGYVDVNETTSKGFNWWFIGNVLLGGIVGMIVDFATGAVYTIKPKEINAQLKQQ